MKKYFIWIILLATIAVSCRKVDDSSLFDKSPDQRLNESLDAYQKQLSGEKNGWKAFVYTKTGGIYTFYFKFNDSNRVQMLSSFDSTSAVTLKESSFRLKALQQPSLLFDTYSYLHVLADPDASVNGGGYGAGLLSDFEFYFDDSTTTDNEITLIGRFNGSKAVLTRATAQEATALANGALAGGLQINKILTYYKRIIINGTDSTDVHIDPLSATITRTDAQGNLLDASRQTSYYLTLGGLGFVKPITVGTKTVSEISGMSYNAATETITAVAGNVPVVIKGVALPIVLDAGAAKRWWQYAVTNGASYWISERGIHKDGKDDYFDFATTVPNYQYMHYWPDYNISGTTVYDVFGFIYINAAGTSLVQYGTAPVPTFTTDGRITYAYLGSLGTSPGAATTPKMTGTTNSVRSVITQPNGFYFVQTGAETYDMVSAFDGKTWISWEW